MGGDYILFYAFSVKWYIITLWDIYVQDVVEQRLLVKP